MTATDIATLTREITVLTFDHYGTLVDMQTGLTEAVTLFLHAKGWSGEPHRFVTWWRRTHYEDSVIDALCDRGHTPYSVWSGNYAMVIPKQLRNLIAAAGWQKQDMQDFIFQPTRLLRHEWATVGKRAIVDRGGGPRQELWCWPTRWPIMTRPLCASKRRRPRNSVSTCYKRGSRSGHSAAAAARVGSPFTRTEDKQA